MKPSERLYRWRQFEAAQTSERDRLNYLRSAPLPVNPPEIMKPTRCKVLKPTFCVKGKQVQVDSIIVMPLHEALGMKSLGKVEFVE